MIEVREGVRYDEGPDGRPSDIRLQGEVTLKRMSYDRWMVYVDGLPEFSLRAVPRLTPDAEHGPAIQSSTVRSLK